MRSLFGLEFKVFSVLTGLALVAITTLGFMVYALNEGRTNQQLVSRLAQLDTFSSIIFGRIEHYLQYSPRSFSDYNRDLIVFYDAFSTVLGRMNGLVNSISEDYYSRAPSKLIEKLGIGLRTEQLDGSFNKMTSAWQKH